VPVSRKRGNSAPIRVNAIHQTAQFSHDGTLASCTGTWQSARMARSPSPRTPLAGGFLIAIGAMAGAGIGLFSPIGPTRGFLVGIALGGALSLALWLVDRRK
jgi:hypothetical protein